MIPLRMNPVSAKRASGLPGTKCWTLRYLPLQGDKRMIPIDEAHVVVTKCLVLVEEIQDPQSLKPQREEVVVDRDNQNRDDQ